MANTDGLIPCRFLCMMAHLVVTITIFWSRQENITACLPLDATTQQKDEKDTQLIIGLSFMLACIGVELIGLLAGLSMFVSSQSLLSIAAHAGASVTLSYFLFDSWECDTFWWIFGFCSAFPALIELILIIVIPLTRTKL